MGNLDFIVQEFIVTQTIEASIRKVCEVGAITVSVCFSQESEGHRKGTSCRVASYGS